jgi:hypothetical protein
MGNLHDIIGGKFFGNNTYRSLKKKFSFLLFQKLAGFFQRCLTRRSHESKTAGSLFLIYSSRQVEVADRRGAGRPPRKSRRKSFLQIELSRLTAHHLQSFILNSILAAASVDTDAGSLHSFLIIRQRKLRRLCPSKNNQRTVCYLEQSYDC